MPAAHRAHKEWTPERLIHGGGDIGANAGRFVTQVLQRFRHPEHGYRSCLGLLSLAKRYGPQRVEVACTLARLVSTSTRISRTNRAPCGVM